MRHWHMCTKNCIIIIDKYAMIADIIGILALYHILVCASIVVLILIPYLQY